MDKETLIKVVAFLTEVIENPKTNEKTAYNTLVLIKQVLEEEAGE